MMRTAWIPLTFAAGLLLACVPLPIRMAPSVSGVVVDADTGRPVPDARVAVRYEGRYEDILPDRRVLGEGESTTDAAGRFRVTPRVRPGFTAWPWLITETRVVSVSAPGYRCASPQRTSEERPVRVTLAPAQNDQDRLASCPAGTALAEDEPISRTAEVSGDDPSWTATLAARRTLGFGANCLGPVLDLSLSPDGRRAAFATETVASVDVQVVALGEDAPPSSASFRPPDRSDWRLVWTAAGALAVAGRRGTDPAGEEAPRVVWNPTESVAPPAAPAFGLTPGADRPFPESADRNDEATLRWFGRTFAVQRSPDPETGLVRESLRVNEPGGTTRELKLPGEPCSLGRRFGRPQERISADERTALDLRWVDGGCHALRIDLESGAWSRLDSSRLTGTCRESRGIPAFVLREAVRGYADDLETRLSSQGLDPRSTFTLWIDPARRVRLTTTDLDGKTHSLDVPPFPIATPLRRIDVTAAGTASVPPAPSVRHRWEPL